MVMISNDIRYPGLSKTGRQRIESAWREMPVLQSSPSVIDEEIARLKLASMNLTIDQLKPYQGKHIISWQEGTA